MDRVQRSGLITLVLLMLVAVAGLVLGPHRPGQDGEAPAGAVLDTELATTLTPPSQRRYSVTPDSFDRGRVRHPIHGGAGRDVNATVGPSNSALRSEILYEDAPGSSAGWEPGGSSAAGEITVRVREHESLSSISKRVTGTVRHAETIRVYNGIEDPRALRIGQSLRIPASLVKGKPASRGPALRVNPPAPGISAGRVYRVRDGDTPGEISMALYGTSRHWKELLRANGITDPKELRAGMQLKVPALQ